MKNEEKLILENLVNEMLNNLYNSSLLNEDIKWDKDGREGSSKEEKCIEEIINILKDKISYY
jgi:hypothetical protein